MTMTKYDKQTVSGSDIYYDIVRNGFHIYIGNTSRPMIIQEEPFIPHPELSYEENAKQMCEAYCNQTSPNDSFEDRISAIEANVDYLMLLTDADSATEEETK